MYLAVDFDGTIVDHRYPVIGELVPDAMKWLRTFNALGFKIILYTMRSDQEQGDFASEAAKFVRSHGVKLFAVNDNPDQLEWSTSRKVYAHMYIDDAAVGTPMIHPEGFNRPCVDWSIVGPMVMGKMGFDIK